MIKKVQCSGLILDQIVANLETREVFFFTQKDVLIKKYTISSKIKNGHILREVQKIPSGS